MCCHPAFMLSCLCVRNEATTGGQFTKLDRPTGLLFYWRKCILERRLQNGGHFVPSSVCKLRRSTPLEKSDMFVWVFFIASRMCRWVIVSARKQASFCGQILKYMSGHNYGHACLVSSPPNPDDNIFTPHAKQFDRNLVYNYQSPMICKISWTSVCDIRSTILSPLWQINVLIVL